MSGMIWSAHSKSTICSWVSTEYADPAPLHISITSRSASVRIESVRQLIVITSFVARPASPFTLARMRSSGTGLRALVCEVRLPQHHWRLCLADVNIGQGLQQPKDIQQPQHNGY